MIDITLQQRIARAPADVFAYVTDPAKLATWQTNTVSAVPEGDGPLAVGTRIREIHRAPGGRQLRSVVEVTALDPPVRFALEVVEGTPVHLRLALDPDDGATLLHLRAHGELAGPLRYAQPVLARLLERQFRQHLRTLAQVLEA